MSNHEGWIEGGNKGDKGDAGAAGSQGPAGDDGAAGAPGAPGTTLHSGLSDVTANQHHAQSHGNADHTSTFVTASDVAPKTSDYLVGTADAGLSGEIVVGTSPGGELGNTWASPTVDASHSGSTHAATQAAAESTASGALTTHAALATHHTRLHSTTDVLDHSFPGGTTTYLRADGTYAAPPGTAQLYVDMEYEDPGSVSIITAALMDKEARLGLSSTERVTMAGTGRLRLNDDTQNPANLRYRAPGSTSLQPDEYALSIDRIDLRGNSRQTMVGNARRQIDNLRPTGRLVLAGRG